MLKKLGSLVPKANKNVGGPNIKGKRIVSLNMVPRNFGSADKLANKSKRRWRLFQFLFALTFFLSILGLITPSSDTVESQPEHEIAERYLESFLTGNNTSLPVTNGISEEWVEILNLGVEPARFSTSLLSSEGNVHTFVVEELDSTYQVSITLQEVGEQKFLGSLPTIEPYLFTPNESIPETFSEGTANLTSDERQLITRLDRWGTAFFDNNPTDLFELTGTNQEISFVGLNNTSYNRGSVTVLQISDTLLSTDENVVVKARFSINFLNRPQSPIFVDYDLLVSEAETQRPNILAWGAPGTGNELEPLENQISTAQSLINEAITGLPNDLVEEPVIEEPVEEEPVEEEPVEEEPVEEEPVEEEPVEEEPVEEEGE